MSNCKNCIVRKYPACSMGIPCCQCSDECNSRQPCPRETDDHDPYRDEDVL